MLHASIHATHVPTSQVFQLLLLALLDQQSTNLVCWVEAKFTIRGVSQQQT